METIFQKRREWVNDSFGKKTSGKSMSNSQKTKLLKQLWKVAKKKFKD